MNGIKGGFDLTFLIPDLLKVSLDVKAEGFSEYFTRFHLPENKAAGDIWEYDTA